MESPEIKSPSEEQAPQSSVAETRTQYIKEVMKGQNPKDRAYFKDEKGQFASPNNENATLRVRDQHIEAAREEMNAYFAQREANQEAVVQAESPNIQTNAQVETETPLRTAAEIAMAGEGQIEQKYKSQESPVERDLHQEALDRNTEANKIPSIEETLRAGKPRYNLRVQRTSGEMEGGWFATGAFQDQDGVDRVRVWKESQDGTVLRKDVKLEDLNQWNGESPNTLSKEGQGFLKDSEEIQKDSQERSFKKSLSELMSEEDAQRYIAFLQRDLAKEPPEKVEPEQQVDTEPGQTPNIQEVFANIDQRLSQTQERLSGIDSRIGEINGQLAEIQATENLTQEQLLKHMRLSQEFQGLMSQRFEALLEQQQLNSEKSSALYRDLISRIGEGQEPETPEVPGIPETPETPTTPTPEVASAEVEQQTPTTPTTEVPEIPEIPGIPETPETPTTPTTGVASAEVEQLRQQLRTQEQEIANLRGENTPEQRSAILGRQLAELDLIREERPLTDQEKIQYFDLLASKRVIDTQLQTVEKESAEKRDRRLKIIKAATFTLTLAVGAFTPPVSAAALIAAGLGGPLIGREGIKFSEKLRAKSNSLKYADRRNKTVAELAEIDKKIKRNELWANRLGAVSSAVIGAGAGYGAGKALQSIVNMFRTPTTPPSGQNPPAGQQTPSQGQQLGENLGGAPPSGEAGPPQGSIEIPPNQPISTTGSELSSGDWLETEGLGWDTSELGWRGPNLFVPQSGVVEGSIPDLQGKFLNQLSELGVTKDMLYGQQAGKIFNQGLRSAAYTPGSNLQEVASVTAEALKNLNP